MLYNFAIILTFFLEMLIAYSFFSQIGRRKYRAVICFAVGTVIFETGALLDIIFSNIIWLNAIYFIVINFVFGIWCFHIKPMKIFFYSVVLDIFSTGLEFASIFIISIATKTEVTAYVDNLSFFILDVSISKTLYFLVCLVISRCIKNDNNNIRFPITLYFYPIAIVGALIVFWNICANSDISNKYQFQLSVISAILVVSTIVLFINYQHNIEKENRLLLLEKEIEKATTDKKYYGILERQNEELMIYAHDTKKHLAAIRELSENEMIDEYVIKMDNELRVHSNICRSGNHFLDLIIHKYQTECSIKKVSFEYDVKLSNLKFVESFDLVTILGNVLDNALEAAVKSKNKHIKLETNHSNNFDIILVTNSCDLPPDKELYTTKKNKKLHGFGMKSVAKTLKKYDGDFEWEYDSNQNLFVITIMLQSE